MEIDVSEIGNPLGKKIGNIIEKIAIEMVNEMKLEAPVDTGRLRQSIQIQAVDETSFYVGTNLNYAKHIQFGAPPHRPHWTSLLKWTRRKLGEDEARASQIFLKIAAEGTDANPFVDRAMDNVRRKYL